jgi:hypothetical protein
MPFNKVALKMCHTEYITYDSTCIRDVYGVFIKEPKDSNGRSKSSFKP